VVCRFIAPMAGKVGEGCATFEETVQAVIDIRDNCLPVINTDGCRRAVTSLLEGGIEMPFRAESQVNFRTPSIRKTPK
jgi:hypothetical protein